MGRSELETHEKHGEESWRNMKNMGRREMEMHEKHGEKRVGDT